MKEPADPPASPPLSSSGRQSPSRKDTILSLVEMLLQESGNMSKGPKGQPPSFEDDRDVPSVDEYLQEAGAEAFQKFQRSINNLDKELRNFANAARQLGSSVAILSSGFRLRERLAQLLFLYRENAADLFPRKVSHVARDSAPSIDVHPGGHRKGRRRKWGKAHLHIPRPTVSEEMDQEKFPDYLEALANDVKTFLNCLNEFPEFTDEAVNASINSFEGDLRYWSSCLREYPKQFRNPAVQRYIHELSQEMGDHINGITSSLCMFIEVGVPTIRFAQKHGSSNLLNLSTIATFFSAVTATTMQFSYELDPAETSSAIVNTFWFSSLVFSIAAAVNSLLGLTWKQAMYRSPGHRVPWWVLIWIKRSPLVFLVLSVACFSIGLCAFSYASHQPHITSTFTTVLTAFTSFGLAAVSAWFASERWAFSRHRGQKWLSDVLKESTNEFIRHPAISWLYKLSKFLSRNIVKFNELVSNAFSGISESCCFRRHSDGESDDIEANGSSGRRQSESPGSPEPTTAQSSTMMLAALPSTSTVRLPPVSPQSPPPPPPPVNSPTSPNDFVPETPASPPAAEGQPAAPSHGKLLWKNAIRTVKLHSNLNASSTGTHPMSMLSSRPIPLRKGTGSSSIGTNMTGLASATTGPGERRRTLMPEPVSNVKSRLSALVPKLALLETTQDLPAHTALVRHIQFSPDGKYLATSSWDRTSVIYKVGDPFVSHKILGHTHGFVGQVAWSPTGNILLTKLKQGIKVWTAEDIKGKVLDSYDLGHIKLYDVAVMPDSTRIVGVGTLLHSPTGLKPSKSRDEKRLVVYNLETKQVESQTPVLNDVRDITIAQARSGTIALISYENKAPPQLWKIELIKEPDNNTMVARLILR
ncbi:hypothetical protein EST38_g6867 [Candolleomyces aberdarensis]|uniref:Uncharacterized protein n=1 Tax=Candolleomyces aberdarensis TaxID=2316362 RepID=A0A4Q2DIJ7_9AGAR|nr:hypothetical protein EST38_g6867 [Candolleomyces aberdarensis]